MSAAYASLREYLADYGRRWPDEEAVIAQFLALLEPVAILLIGGAIGVIMIGIILAITSANDIAV